MITDVFGVEMVHEPIWAIVDRQTHNRHVVCVEDTMAEADRLPESSQLSGSLNNCLKKLKVALLSWLSCDLLVKIIDHIIYHIIHFLSLHTGRGTCSLRLSISLRKNLEWSKPHKCWRNSHDDRTLLIFRVPIVEFVTLYFRDVAYDQRRCTCCWHTEVKHGFGAEKLSDRWTEHSTTVRLPRIRCHASTLKLQV